ncbi:hypothetical protein SAMN05444126_10824 [Salisediminibacterium halotolerans]|uniref:Uncharacterized protein n=1 Tax=Salisediminibacterium halotolerans TaxID=517425 RepID=A0A1H9SUG6_9BACI|nr:hypothetical protein SAMN05444126_10824 [Salisediminibacterium haloalkalitolerans]
MSNFAKTMLFWLIAFPILTTVLIIIIDYFRGITIEVTSYWPNVLGLAVGGILVGFVHFNAKKLLTNKNA